MFIKMEKKQQQNNHIKTNGMNNWNRVLYYKKSLLNAALHISKTLSDA